MSIKFNIDRPKISDQEINKNKNFNELVEQFKQHSLKKANADKSWWKNKIIRYSTIILGITVICSVSYLSLINNQKNKRQTTSTNQSIKTKNKAFIQAPSQKITIPNTKYKVNNNKNTTILHTSNTKIKIPKNSFVDKNGKDIIGDVTIEYKEMLDIGDVILSGIPMHYDSLGHSFNFESAGMFNIKGRQNNEPVFIKQNKKIEIELCSKNNEDVFNQYYLDTVSKKWNYLRKDIIIKNQLSHSVQNKNEIKLNEILSQSQKLNTLKKEITIEIPQKIDSVKFVCNKSIDKLPKGQIPYIPIKSSPDKPTFKIDGSFDEFPELMAFKNILFEVGTENKNYSKEIHDVTWSNLKIKQGTIKGKNYLLELSYRNKKEKLIVYPVLNESDYKIAQIQYENQLLTYQKLLDKRLADEQRLIKEMETKQKLYLAEIKKKEAAYNAEKLKLIERYNLEDQNELANNFKSLSNVNRTTRLFQISQFGIYNSDCPHANSKGIEIKPIFILNETKKSLKPDYIYLINHDNKMVYGLNALEATKLNYEPNGNYSFCIFHKNILFICSKNAFNETINKNNCQFILQSLPKMSENIIEFKKALEI